MPLRPDQDKMIAEVTKAFRAGHRRVLMQCCTGYGKTFVAAALLRRCVTKGKHGLFIVHLDAIVEDTMERLQGAGFRVGRVQAAYLRDPDAEVHVASLQTMLSQDYWPAADLVIYDECFPPGTQVDGRNIEDIKVGDLVRSYNHQTEEIELKPVKRVFVSHGKPVVRVMLADGSSVVSTPNHPYYVDCESYVEAQHLTGKRLHCLGRPAEVVGVTSWGMADTVYNLEVADNRNYFVSDILVHNCHHAAADGASQIFEKYKGKHLIGCSATPETNSGRGLAHLFDVLLQGPQPQELIRSGILVKPLVYSPPTQGQDLARDPVAALAEFAPGRQSVVFSKNAAQAREIQARLPSSELYLDDTPHPKRREIMRTLRDGTLRHVVTVRAILEGADVKTISAVVLCTPFSSAGGMLQAVGRGLRSDPANGKKNCVVIDLRGAALEWGLPDEDRLWKLQGAASRRTCEAVLPLRRCKDCLAVFAAASVCPRCGARQGSIETPEQAKVTRRDMHLLLPPEARHAKATIYLAKLKQILILRGMWPQKAARVAMEKAPVWVRDALHYVAPSESRP